MMFKAEQQIIYDHYYMQYNTMYNLHPMIPNTVFMMVWNH